MLFLSTILLSFLLLNYSLAANVSDYENWSPDPNDGFIYCEMVSGTQTESLQVAGTACGSVSYKKMQAADPAVNVADLGGSLGLLRIEWIARRAITDKDFYNTCKQYFVRLYDTLYKYYLHNKCVISVPIVDGLDPSCNDTGNVMMRSGSGYCMSEPVCGASVPIYFFQSPDRNSFLYAWTNESVAAWTSDQEKYQEVGKCYGYSVIPSATPLNATILKS